MRPRTTAWILGALFVTTAFGVSQAEARRWRHGPGGPGGPGGPEGFGPRRCAAMLLHAHPDTIKEKLGINDGQLQRIQSIRNNFLSKRITLRAQVQQQRLKMAQLMQQDLPPQNKVLQAMRKARSVRGVLAEERIKAQLKMLAVLTPEQRKTMRAQCGKFRGKGRGWGRGRGRGFGPRGGGGPGPGPGGPGGW